MKGAIVCSFSAALEDLTRQQQADHVTVLRVLKRTGRFSAFEASDNLTIARTITRLLNKGCTVVKPDGTRVEYGLLVERIGGEYPWTRVRLTEGGERLLADNPEGAA